MKKLIGPFVQILTLADMPMKGALSDDQLQIINNGWILIDGKIIEAIGEKSDLESLVGQGSFEVENITTDAVLLPGIIDSHTHICYGGNRAADFAARNAGKTYLEIAKNGGGIWSTVKHTRAATEDFLVYRMHRHLDDMLSRGVTTAEAKSGYGLTVTDEIKMLRAIKSAGSNHAIDLVSTCLAAHIVPKDFEGDDVAYVSYILDKLVPEIVNNNLTNRFDVFIEDSAFGHDASRFYLSKLKEQGFDLTVHGDQFTTGGSALAVEFNAKSVDHLEVSTDKEISLIANSDTVATALPGASLGIGCKFTPARKLLDAGACLSIASDWNPGSAPQGNLLAQASILACFEKLSTAEVLAAITFRAAHALGLSDRGILASGMMADFIAFPTDDYRNILYRQGELLPYQVWKNGNALM